MKKYDVVVIGAGPAGTYAAAKLALAGKSVFIAEKKPYPKCKIGESLLPKGNDLLKEIGVWDKIETAGFIKKFGAEFETPNGYKQVHNIFSRSLSNGLNYTYQVERPKFDQILLDHARSLGCQCDQSTEIKKVFPEPSGYLLTCGNGEELKTRWLIDASGRNRILGRSFKLPQLPNPYPSRIVVYNHFRDVVRKSGKEAGNIIITRRKDGWFWQIPITDSITSIGCIGPSEDIQKRNLSPEDWFTENLKSTPALLKRMANATEINKYQTTSDYSHMYKDFAGRNYFLVGDAATFTDPVFSSGVYLGLLSSDLACQALIKADQRSGFLRPNEQRKYTKQFKRHTVVVRHLIDAFYHDPSFAVFMNPTDKFSLFAAVNSIVSGDTSPPNRIKWRFALFRLICRLNSKYRLVKPVI